MKIILASKSNVRKEILEKNNLNPEVAEDPENLIVYGGIGKAARNWEAYEDILKSLKVLENDETLLIPGLNIK